MPTPSARSIPRSRLNRRSSCSPGTRRLRSWAAAHSRRWRRRTSPRRLPRLVDGASAGVAGDGHGSCAAHRALGPAGPGARQPAVRCARSEGRRRSPVAGAGVRPCRRRGTLRDADRGRRAGRNGARAAPARAPRARAWRTARGRDACDTARGCDRRARRVHGEPARRERSVPGRVRRRAAARRTCWCCSASSRISRLRFGAPPAIAATCRFVVHRSRAGRAAARARDAWAGSRRCSPRSPTRWPPPRRCSRARGARGAGAWAREVEAAIAFRPADWGTLASPAGGPLHPVEVGRAVQQILDRARDAGARRRRRRVRAMGAGVRERAHASHQRSGRLHRVRAAVRARGARRAARTPRWWRCSATAPSAFTWPSSTPPCARDCRSSP